MLKGFAGSVTVHAAVSLTQALRLVQFGRIPPRLRSPTDARREDDDDEEQTPYYYPSSPDLTNRGVDPHRTPRPEQAAPLKQASRGDAS